MSPVVPSPESLLAEAVAIPDPTERERYVDQACAADDSLRAEIHRLLQAHDQAGAFLQHPPALPDGANTVAFQPKLLDLPLDTIIGPYLLREKIGEGGMGSVYLAEQEVPVKRRVALKVIKPGMESKQVVARFEAERQALALMDHPNIARVLDGGATADGRPYFVMELVRGLPLTEYCDQMRLSTRDRLALFVDVCRAVQHAHQKGVIHRDLKPSNILVTVYDGKAVPKVIDFGVAKAIGPPLTADAAYTAFAQLVGTPMYMSPEQVELSAVDVDTRADVYSLGVVLYQLLTGTTPVDAETLRKAGFDGMRKIIREDEPPRPSERLSTLDAKARSTVSDRRRVDERRLSQQLKGELDWVVMKALEKDRSRRYQTPADMAADVEHYLSGEPVAAHPPSTWYRMRKFVRRNKAGVSVTALAVLALVIVTGSVGWVSADRMTRRALAQVRVSDAATRAETLLGDGNPYAADLVTAIRQAEAELDSGLVDEKLRRRIEQVVADQRMLTQLEQIRLDQSAVKENHFDFAGADWKYAQAFLAYGIDVDSLGVPSAANRIRELSISVQLAAALDDWASARRAALKEDAAGWKRLLEVSLVADPDPWRGSLRQAMAFGARKELEDLARTVVVAEQPPTSLARLGFLLQESGAKGAAVKLLRQGCQRYPADFWLNHYLGFALATMEPPALAEAEGYFRVAVALRPQSPGARYNLGNVLAFQGRPGQAIACYWEAIRLKPDYSEPYVNLGNQLNIQGKLAEAIASFREAIRLNPSSVAAHVNLASALNTQGETVEAIASYREAIRLKPDEFAAHYNLGNALRKHGKVLDAIASYREAIRLNPDFADAQQNLGIEFIGQGKLDDAITAFKEVIRVEPKAADAHCELGDALAAKGKVTDAVASYREAIRLKSDYADAHFSLGNALQKQEKLEEAIACFLEVIRLEPNAANAHLNLGNALYKQGKVAAALASYREAIRLKPNHGKALNRLAWALAAGPVAQPDSKKAVEYARKALLFMPNEAGFLNTLGIALYRNSDWKEAAETLKKSIQVDKGGTASDFFFLAMTHEKLGDKTLAREWFDRAIAWMDKEAPKDEELSRFRAEAAELLGITLPATTGPKK